jgi:hypothetical protein
MENLKGRRIIGVEKEVSIRGHYANSAIDRGLGAELNLIKSNHAANYAST